MFLFNFLKTVLGSPHWNMNALIALNCCMNVNEGKAEFYGRAVVLQAFCARLRPVLLLTKPPD